LKIDVIYRCFEEDQKVGCRPAYFSKLKCLENLLWTFKNSTIHCVHDGPKGALYDRFERQMGLDRACEIIKINENSNGASLAYCLEYANSLPEEDDGIIYFVEDDYLHTEDAEAVLIDGLRTSARFNGSNIVSTYCHPDRLTRTDDIDRGQTHILLGAKRYWRTAESTTCTWAALQSTFREDLYGPAKQFGLRDREFFRALRPKGTILFTPMHAASTHCHLPFMSPFIDWSKV
jgi:hypothetical protein